MSDIIMITHNEEGNIPSRLITSDVSTGGLLFPRDARSSLLDVSFIRWRKRDSP